VTRYVLDASVAAKWYLPPSDEPLSAEAASLLQQYAAGNCRLLVPDVFWIEAANTLWKSVQRGKISRTASETAIEALQRTQIPTAPSLPLLREALQIAADYRRPVYDALYVALAVASNAVLLTADERLANALAARFPIRWLGAV